MTNINLQTISYIVGFLGIVFAVYLYFRNPQEKLDKDASILEQRVQWEKESNEKRFSDMGIRMDNALTLAQNHTHTVDVKVDGLIGSVNTMNLQLTNAITRLETTINERIPKK